MTASRAASSFNSPVGSHCGQIPPAASIDEYSNVATDARRGEADVLFAEQPKPVDQPDEDNDAEPDDSMAKDELYTYEDELSPTQQQLVDIPMGQGNRFRSYEVLEEIPRMPSFVSIEDDFVGSEGLAELGRKVQLLQDGVRDELGKRDKGMCDLQGRITDGRNKVDELTKDVEKERNARVTLFEKRKDDEKTVQALKDELAEAKTTIQALGTELADEKAARQAIEKRLEKLEHAFGEIIQTRESDDDADHLGEQRGKKRARPC